MSLFRRQLPVEDRPRLALAAVALLHLLSPLLIVGLPLGFEQDETVYISQVSRAVPAGFFSPPRARGMTFLVAPIAQLTTSSSAIRVYLAALSAVGLYLAFRPWLRIRSGYAVPLAAALFSILWTTIYYGFEAQPNIYVAIGAVAATGYLSLLLRHPGPRRTWWLLVVWVTLVGLVRPSDAFYLCIGLTLVTVFARREIWRDRLRVLAGIVLGLAAGWLEWVIEAYVRYGGLFTRLHAAAAENGGGLHMSLGLQARALSGPTLCRPCAHPVQTHAVIWWFLVPPIVAAGCLAARRTTHSVAMLACVVCAVALGLEYIVGVDYAAARFLIPTYALLSIPASEGLCWLATRRWRRWEPRVAIPVIALAVLAQFGSEIVVLRHDVLPPQRRFRAQDLTVVHDVEAVSPTSPCLILGFRAAPVAFGTHCSDVPLLIFTPEVIAKADDHRTTIVVLRPDRAPIGSFYSHWPVVRLRGPALLHRVFAYLHRPSQHVIGAVAGQAK